MGLALEMRSPEHSTLCGFSSTEDSYWYTQPHTTTHVRGGVVRHGVRGGVTPGQVTNPKWKMETALLRDTSIHPPRAQAGTTARGAGRCKDDGIRDPQCPRVLPGGDCTQGRQKMRQLMV